MQGGKAKPNSWWQKIKKLLEIVAVIIALILLATLIILIVQGYRLNWAWAGLGPYITPAHPKDTDFQRGKTLWDWLQLLIIPLVLAVLALLFNLANSRRERQIAEKRYKQDQQIAKQRYEQDQQIALDKQREDLLQAYLDCISELLLKEKLRSSAVDAEVRNVARVRTITILTQLDARRIGYVFAFLREARLMSTTPNDNVVSLKEADLHTVNWSQAYLSGANLSGAYLIEANLSYADLDEANLSEAHLSRANFNGANLNGADLNGADLSLANLSYADLSGANLYRAILSGANLYRVSLSGANLYRASLIGSDLHGANLKGATGITNEELEKVANSLEGATMPDGSKHP